MKNPFALWLVALTSFSSLALTACDGGEESEPRANPHPIARQPASRMPTRRSVRAIYTANKGASSNSRIDLASGQVVMFPIGLVPHNVQVSADGRSIVAVDHINEFAPEIGET